MSHHSLLTELKKNRGKGTLWSDSDSYLSSGHYYYSVSVPIRRKIAEDWLKKNRKISQKDFAKVIDSLYKGKSHEEKSIASMLLGYSYHRREKIRVKQLAVWLNHLSGWAEIDSLCQNIFTAKEILKDWEKWSAFIRQLSKDENINKRRASLVFLTSPVTYSNDKKLLNFSFEIIEKLKHEKPILITKAISWLLRSTVTLHKREVSVYINKNLKTLPKIAIRETLRKIRTGRK